MKFDQITSFWQLFISNAVELNQGINGSTLWKVVEVPTLRRLRRKVGYLVLSTDILINSMGWVAV